MLFSCKFFNILKTKYLIFLFPRSVNETKPQEKKVYVGKGYNGSALMEMECPNTTFPKSLTDWTKLKEWSK